MKKYKWVLFDADDTLFHFDALSGLQHMFAKYKVKFTKQDYQEYQTINRALWIKYQDGKIVAKQLQHQRFDVWASRLQIPSQVLNSAFLSAMADICTPIEGAVSLLKALEGKSKLGIITNGFIELQQVRLDRTGLRKYFDIVVISEEVGFAKPHRGIFDHALSLMGNPLPEQVLMVGDNPDTDIVGGLNAGLDTCWLNSQTKPTSEGVTPHYEVSTLQELQFLLAGKQKQPIKLA